MIDPRAFLREHAAWLLDEGLGTCVVGSSALAEACRRAGTVGPVAADLDLSWALDVDAGSRLLSERGVSVPTTEHNRARGTLALSVGGERIEITTLRAGDPNAPLAERIAADLGARDMTVGAVAWWLGEDRVLDPLGGVDDWRGGRIVPVGDPAERIREHPVRWLRYYRRAHQWSFDLDRRVRRVEHETLYPLLDAIPPEALGAELRAALLDCSSPGRFLLELAEIGVLQRIAPELAPQFDGRPAGPVRHHPEVSQALHLILTLEWITDRTRSLSDTERLRAAIAVLCHDLGKNLTPAGAFPSHPGHEDEGVPLVDGLLTRLPIADAAARRLAVAVCRLHLVMRRFDELRPGTLAELYERWFRPRDFPVELFALALGADVGGRLDMSAEGDVVARTVAANVNWLRACCGSVDAGALRAAHADVEDFRRALHEARARAIASARRRDD